MATGTIPNPAGTHKTTANVGECIKLPNGTMIHMIFKQETVTPTSQYGSMYYGSPVSFGNWSTAFATDSSPYVIGQIYAVDGGADAFLGKIYGASRISAGSAYVYFPQSYSSPINVGISIIAIGRWRW